MGRWDLRGSDTTEDEVEEQQEPALDSTLDRKKGAIQAGFLPDS